MNLYLFLYFNFFEAIINQLFNKEEIIMNKAKNKNSTKVEALPTLPRGMGSFSYKENGSIIFRKRIELNNGKKIDIAVVGTTVSECFELMRTRENEKMKSVVAPNKETLVVGMRAWLENYQRNMLKPQSYKRLKGTIENQIGKSNLANERYYNIDCDDIQNLINSLNRKGYSYSTIKKAYDALNAFYRHSAAKYKIDNPMLLVIKPTKANTNKKVKEIVWFEDEDIIKFVAKAVETYKTGKYIYKDGPVYAANIYMGLRIGELLALKWKDVDFENKCIYVCKTTIEIPNPDYNKDDPKSGKTIIVIQESSKTDVNRYVPLSSKAISILKEYNRR